MTTFVLLSKVSPESLKRVKNLAEMGKVFDRKLADHCPGVRRVASFALLGAYDFLHIFEAAKVALISNEFGAGSTQTLTAIPFDQFSKLVKEIS
jgi:uncharacterized protein with GYD domain